MKGSNVYKIDDKYYARNVEYASCCELIGETYYVTCDIKMRGSNLYTYEKGNDYITKVTSPDTKRKTILYLEGYALNTVLSSINIIDRVIDEAKDKEVFNKCYLYYKKSNNGYDFLYKMTGYDVPSYKYYEDMTVSKLIHRLNIQSEVELENDVLYKTSVFLDDKKLQSEIRIQYHKDTKEDCDYVGALPKASESLNKDFIIYRDDIDYKLLEYSGYRIWHRPYFGMKGSTHEKWTINPYTRYVLDAAKENSEAITFGEFVKILKQEPYDNNNSIVIKREYFDDDDAFYNYCIGVTRKRTKDMYEMGIRNYNDCINQKLNPIIIDISDYSWLYNDLCNELAYYLFHRKLEEYGIMIIK